MVKAYAAGVLAFPSSDSGRAAERYFMINIFGFALGERKTEKHKLVSTMLPQALGDYKRKCVGRTDKEAWFEIAL